MPKERNVMVIYGHCDPLNKSVVTMLRRMGLNPMDWEELVLNAGGGRVTLDIVVNAFSTVQAVVVILYGEEEVKLIPKLVVKTNDTRLQPRANVLIELGMALMAMRDNTILLQFGHFDVPSDIDGLNRLDFRKDPFQKRRALFNQVQKMGCDVNEHDTTFLSDDIDLTCSKSRLAP